MTKPGRVYVTFTAKNEGACGAAGHMRTDLEGLLKFANAIVKERRTNSRLGITCLD